MFSNQKFREEIIMKKILALSIAVYHLINAAYSQRATDANIFGHVLNRRTGEHLAFIHIGVKGTTIGTSTDATGHYFLRNLPLGEFTLVAHGIGYKTQEKIVVLTEGRTIEINFELEEDPVELESVVIAASREEISRKDAPGMVSILSPRLFENTNSVCLAQGLNFVPGLRVETNCQSCGLQQVRINGLEGPYTQILIDGRPLFTSLAGVYGLEQIPANIIDRVEVVRGGGSVMYGSSAIAGVINVITREPTANTLSLSQTHSLISGKSTDNMTSFNASVVSDDFRSGAVVIGSTRNRSGFDYNSDGFTELPRLNQNHAAIRGYYRMNNYNKLTVEYHNLDEYRRGGNNLGLPPHEADIAEQLEHNNHIGGLRYDLFSVNYLHRLTAFTALQHIHRKSYFGAGRDPQAYGTTRDNTVVSGFQYTYSPERFIFMPAELTAGLEYFHNNLQDEILGYNRLIRQNIHHWSTFLQSEWINHRTGIQMGLRIDRHNLIHQLVWSPRANFRYQLAESLVLRAGFSTGFRAPQAFDEDLHINAVGGNVLLITMDPALKTERSASYTASADYYFTAGKLYLNVLVEGFYTRLSNVFVLEEAGIDQNGNIIMERRNGAGAVVRGINLESRMIPSDKIQMQLGITFQESEYTEPLQWSSNENLQPRRTMFRSPNRYGYITGSYQLNKNFNASLSGVYTGRMLVQHYAGFIPEDTEKWTPQFFDLTLRLSHDFRLDKSTRIQLNAGIQNLFNSFQKDFDRGELRDSGYVYGPSLPRTFFAGFKLTI